MQTNKEIFENIYRDKVWHVPEINGPLSGPGSTLEYTERLRANLPSILESFGINTLLDAGCGDLTWMSSLLNSKVNYIGVDVVETIIEDHKKRFPDVEFHVKDITTDPLPKADMMLCRDCLFHMSNEDIFRTLGNFVKSNIPYIFTTSHVTNNPNYDIRTGEFRILNLLDMPFNLPTPIYGIDDTYGGHPQRNMFIWSRYQIEKALQYK